MPRDPSVILEAYSAELKLLDQLLAKGPGTYHLRMQTHANCIALRHRIYKARSADRRITQASGFPHSMYDRIRILAPTLDSDGLTYKLTILVLKSPTEIVGLLDGDVED